MRLFCSIIHSGVYQAGSSPEFLVVQVSNFNPVHFLFIQRTSVVNKIPLGDMSRDALALSIEVNSGCSYIEIAYYLVYGSQ